MRYRRKGPDLVLRRGCEDLRERSRLVVRPDDAEPLLHADVARRQPDEAPKQEARDEPDPLGSRRRAEPLLRMLLRRPQLVVELTIGLSVGRLNAYWLRDVLAVDLAFEQDADREVVEHDQPAAPAEGVEPRKLGQRPRQAGNHVACERQPLARVLAVLGDETPRPGDVHLCHEVDRVALPADRCGRSNHLSVAAERFGPIPPACAHRLLPAEGVLCPAPWIEARRTVLLSSA